MSDRDPLWYKDAVFYELHVRAFKDGNDDGIGDFIGLTSQLGYLKELGVDCLWLLPFFRSPLRDDGYDVADYRAIHPDYGTMADFDRFLEAAHGRGMRVISDLVVNHTSDQHPWFQAARRSPDSPYRDYYVWSDTDERYRDARIIFVDTEHSNWTWDPVAKAYYWHRFFHHQPDLNFDNPAGPPRAARRHALLARQGPRRLPLRRRALPLRARGHQLREPARDARLPARRSARTIDARVPGAHSAGRGQPVARRRPPLLRRRRRVPHGLPLPADAAHLPGRPPRGPPPDHRHLRAHARDPARRPVVPLPAQPRRAHARDGERRGAPPSLLRLRLRPAHAAEPRASGGGSPRCSRTTGARSSCSRACSSPCPAARSSTTATSSAWATTSTSATATGSAPRCSGRATATRASPAPTPRASTCPSSWTRSTATRPSTWRPSSARPSSLLNWMKRLIAVRRKTRVFGRGTLTFLRPANESVLAHVREHEGETVIAVHNLAGSAQPVELDLRAWRRAHPGRDAGRHPLPHHRRLSPTSSAWRPTATTGSGSSRPCPTSPSMASRPLRSDARRARRAALGPRPLRSRALPDPPALVRGQDPRHRGGRRCCDWAVLDPDGPLVLLLLAVDGDPLLRPGHRGRRRPRRRPRWPAPARTRSSTPTTTRASAGASSPPSRPGRSADGRARPLRLPAHPGLGVPARSGRAGRAGASPASRAIPRSSWAALVLKSLRRPQPGLNPDLEITRFLTTRTGFRHVPRLAGWVEYAGAGEPAILAVLQEFVPEYRATDGRTWSRRSRAAAPPSSAGPIRCSRTCTVLGAITGGLHAALASDDRRRRTSARSPSAATTSRGWAGEITPGAGRPRRPRPARRRRRPVADAVARALAALDGLAGATVKIRVPRRLPSRAGAQDAGRLRDHRLRGRAGAARSPSGARSSRPCATWPACCARSTTRRTRSPSVGPRAERPAALAALTAWEAQARDAFLGRLPGARSTESPVPLVPATAGALRAGVRPLRARRRPAYELRYELDNRPDWVAIPLAGIRRILGRSPTSG